MLKLNRQPIVAGILIGSVVLFALLALLSRRNPSNPGSIITKVETKLSRFESEADFKAFIQRGQESAQFYGFGGIATGALEATAQDLAAPGFSPGAKNEQGAGRVSETNVQVRGIDEPDIVKTDGKNIYLSSQFYNIYFSQSAGIVEDRAILPPQNTSQTDIITAFPPANLAKTGTINTTGELLLSGNILVVQSGNSLAGYDVSDPQNPKEIWKSDFDQNYITASRLKDNTLYVVTQSAINYGNPCPIPLIKSVNTVIPCDTIYHPGVDVNIDSTFTVLSINPKDGKVNQNVSFVGSAGQSVTYVSPNAIYSTYTYPGDYLAFFSRFLSEKARDLVSSDVIERIDQIRGYDISHQSKLTELQLTIEKYKNSLEEAERLKFENELTNRMQDFAKVHARELETTGIVKVELNGLRVAATGGIPGHPLNQFSLDEYNNYLRVVTTTSGSFLVNTESTNDLYILDSSLNVTGSITDLGVDERIYSARFIGDKGYLVTFKQIDPFFVLDLSDPRNPKKAGELKIPGFSSYLHPLKNNLILGVGQEESRVKLSLFDVSNPGSPVEVSKYVLDEFWTEVSNNHHAFLQDERHQVFFLPGGKGGYIFSYENNSLKLTEAVSTQSAKRAIYLNDYLYVISDTSIVVFDESTWTEVKRLTL